MEYSSSFHKDEETFFLSYLLLSFWRFARKKEKGILEFFEAPQVVVGCVILALHFGLQLGMSSWDIPLKTFTDVGNLCD